MKTILLATDKPFSKDAVASIRQVVENSGNRLELLEGYTDKAELLKAVSEVDAMIVRSDLITAEVLEAAKKLKIVVRAGAGYDNIDTKIAKEKGVVVMNTPGQNSNAVAELVFGMMVYVARGFYDGKTGTELRGKKLGIHAYGYVGKLVAEVAKGFGMELFAFDPFISDDVIAKDGITPVHSAEELYAVCDYVSLHIPANDKTKKSINYDLLTRLPKGATLVNTARKEVIDEEGLKRVFADRPDFKYVSDVAPDCHAELTEAYKNRYYSTPKKMGAQTNEANVNAGIAAAKQIADFFATGNTTFQVNK